MNLDNPVEIGPDTYWVGSTAVELLKRNVYLRVFRGNGKQYNLLIDPGPQADFDTVVVKTAKVIGSLADVNIVFSNHQDPDVIGCAASLVKLNPRMLFFMTEDTWRLTQYYGIPKANYRPIEQFSDRRVTFGTGHELQFIPTPVCHFRGACMLYDPQTRILFSGDLFGGIAAPGLKASLASWPGIKAFHELYMPANEALRLAVKRIRALSPAPLMIAPQHGSVIEGDYLEKFLERMTDLRVGLDILNAVEDYAPRIIEASNRILEAAREMLGGEAVSRVTKFFHHDGSYPAIFMLDRNDLVTDIKAEPLSAVASLVKLLFRECDDQQKRELKLKVLVIFVERDLPPIESAIEWEEKVKTDMIVPRAGSD